MFHPQGCGSWNLGGSIAAQRVTWWSRTEGMWLVFFVLWKNILPYFDIYIYIHIYIYIGETLKIYGCFNIYIYITIFYLYINNFNNFNSFLWLWLVESPTLQGLHPNVAWAMLNAAEVLPGELLLDPMCGTGMLLTEAPEHCHVLGLCAGQMLGWDEYMDDIIYNHDHGY